MSKQDRQGARTVPDLERKYNFGTRFSEILGIATDARESVDRVESELRDEITEQYSSFVRDTGHIQMEVAKVIEDLKGYVETKDYDELNQKVQTQLSIMSDQITMGFTTVNQEITNVDNDMQSKFTELYEWIKIAGGVMTFGSSDSAITLSIENESIVFKKNDVEFGSWDGDNFYTGNIVIRLGERFQLGNFAFKPRPDGSMIFVWVGE